MIAAVERARVGVEAREREEGHRQPGGIVARIRRGQLRPRAAVYDEEDQQIAARHVDRPVGDRRVGPGRKQRLRASQCCGEVTRLGRAQGADPPVQVVDLERVELVRDAGLREHEIESQIARPASGHAKDLDVGDRNEVGALELHRGRVLVSADRQPRQSRDGRIRPCRRRAGPAHGTCDGARDERALQTSSKGGRSHAVQETMDDSATCRSPEVCALPALEARH